MDTTTLLDGTSVLEDPDLHEQQVCLPTRADSASAGARLAKFGP